MSRESLLIVLGALVALSPFSGVPISWLSILLPILGMLIVIIGITLAKRRQERETPPHEVSAPDHE